MVEHKVIITYISSLTRNSNSLQKKQDEFIVIYFLSFLLSYPMFFFPHIVAWLLLRLLLGPDASTRLKWQSLFFLCLLYNGWQPHFLLFWITNLTRLYKNQQVRKKEVLDDRERDSWRLLEVSYLYTHVYMSLGYHVQTLIGHRVFLNGYLKRKGVLIQVVCKDIYSRSLQIVNFVMSHMLII